ncbi:MAG TPA: MIP/aquaporin family protein [Gemmatimonadales bacterium]
MTTDRRDPRRWVAEGIGTFFLVFAGAGAVMANAASHGVVSHVGVALAFAFVIVAMICAVGHLSGAHLNPAVTIGFWASGRFPAAEVIPYLVSQCIGAIAAATLLRETMGVVGDMGATLPSIAIGPAFAIELVMSFALMFVIMAVATDDRVAGGTAALAVGFTVGFCALTGRTLTGASMNPARSLGPALLGGLWRAHWVYWVAPIAGMVLAAKMYEWLRSATPPPMPGR